MSESLRDVVNGFTPSTDALNEFAPKLTDENVKYNLLGKVPRRGGQSWTGVRVSTEVMNIGTFNNAGNISKQIKRGPGLDADITLLPSMFDPDCVMLMTDADLTGNRTWAFPNDATVVTYLQDKYDGNFVSGTMWEVKFLNGDTLGNAVALDFNAFFRAVVGANGVNAADVAAVGFHRLESGDSCSVMFLVDVTTPGAEALRVYVTGGTKYVP